MEPLEQKTEQNPLNPPNSESSVPVPTPQNMELDTPAQPQVVPTLTEAPPVPVSTPPVPTPTAAPEVIANPSTQPVAQPEVMEFAGIGRRFVATIVDGFVVSALTFGLNTSILANARGNPQVTVNEYGELVTTGGNIFIILQLASWILYAAYYIYFIGSKGQTLGKKLLHVKVVTTSGDQPSFGQATIRFVMSIVSGAILGLGYLAAFFNKQKQTWHDNVADTYVVRSK